MAGESQFSLFGMPSPEEIRARIGRTKHGQEVAQAGGNLTNLTMLQAGRRLGDGVAGLFGYEDPEVEAEINRANTMRTLMASAYEASGGDVSRYVPEVAKQFMSAGLYQEAMQVLQMNADTDLKSAQADKARAEAGRAEAMPLLEAAKIQQTQAQAAVKEAQWEREFALLQSKFDRSTEEGDRNYRLEEAKLRAQITAEQRKFEESQAKIEDFYSKIGYRAGLLQLYNDRLEAAKTEAERKAANNRLNEMKADLAKDFQNAKLEQLKDIYPDAKSISDLPPEASLPIMREVNQFMSSANVLEQLLGHAIFDSLTSPNENDPMGIK